MGKESRGLVEERRNDHELTNDANSTLATDLVGSSDIRAVESSSTDASST